MKRKKTREPRPPSKCAICEADLTGKNGVIFPGLGETCMGGECERAGREKRNARYKKEPDAAEREETSV